MKDKKNINPTLKPSYHLYMSALSANPCMQTYPVSPPRRTRSHSEPFFYSFFFFLIIFINHVQETGHMSKKNKDYGFMNEQLGTQNKHVRSLIERSI